MIINVPREHFFYRESRGYLSVGIKTLQRWDREGRLAAERTPTGRHSYQKAALDVFMRRDPPAAARTPVAYLPGLKRGA